jgi:hypothetical protein
MTNTRFPKMQKTILLYIFLLGLFSLNAQGDCRKKNEAQREENSNKGLLSNEEFFAKAELVIKEDLISLHNNINN